MSRPQTNFAAPLPWDDMLCFFLCFVCMRICTTKSPPVGGDSASAFVFAFVFFGRPPSPLLGCLWFCESASFLFLKVSLPTPGLLWLIFLLSDWWKRKRDFRSDTKSAILTQSNQMIFDPNLFYPPNPNRASPIWSRFFNGMRGSGCSLKKENYRIPSIPHKAHIRSTTAPLLHVPLLHLLLPLLMLLLWLPLTANQRDTFYYAPAGSAYSHPMSSDVSSSYCWWPCCKTTAVAAAAAAADRALATLNDVQWRKRKEKADNASPRQRNAFLTEITW